MMPNLCKRQIEGEGQALFSLPFLATSCGHNPSSLGSWCRTNVLQLSFFAVIARGGAGVSFEDQLDLLLWPQFKKNDIKGSVQAKTSTNFLLPCAFA